VITIRAEVALMETNPQSAVLISQRFEVFEDLLLRTGYEVKGVVCPDWLS
jgi:hypothetical protein